jgi:hypothetical protein
MFPSFEVAGRTNLKEFGELDGQDTTSCHGCESPENLIHQWAQGSKEWRAPGRFVVNQELLIKRSNCVSVKYCGGVKDVESW